MRVQRSGQHNDLVRRMALAHDHARAGAPGEAGEVPVEFDDAGVDELDPAVCTGQRIEDLGVEDEHAPDPARGAQRVVQRGVIFDAKVTAEPDEGVVQSLFHAASLPQE